MRFFILPLDIYLAGLAGLFAVHAGFVGGETVGSLPHEPERAPDEDVLGALVGDGTVPVDLGDAEGFQGEEVDEKEADAQHQTVKAHGGGDEDEDVAQDGHGGAEFGDEEGCDA